MIVSEGKVLTFLEKIIDKNGKELVCYRKKLIFNQNRMNRKLYAAMQDQTIGKTVSVFISKSEIESYQPDKLITVPKKAFHGDIDFKKGMLIKTSYQQETILAHVNQVNEESLVIDLNTYLSKYNDDFTYEVTILDIENPSTELLSNPNFVELNLILNDRESIKIV